jgi:proteasome lid subunit RPN8/RPN11
VQVAPLVIRLGDDVLGAIRREAAAAYPEESCGVFVGRDDDTGVRVIERVIHVPNATVENRSRRFLIPAASVLRAEREAEAAGLDVVGFHHSHPDQAAEPSGYDLEHAWPWYVYVIIGVRDGIAELPRAWRMRDDRSGFDELCVETRAQR